MSISVLTRKRPRGCSRHHDHIDRGAILWLLVNPKSVDSKYILLENSLSASLPAIVGSQLASLATGDRNMSTYPLHEWLSESRSKQTQTKAWDFQRRVQWLRRAISISRFSQVVYRDTDLHPKHVDQEQHKWYKPKQYKSSQNATAVENCNFLGKAKNNGSKTNWVIEPANVTLFSLRDNVRSEVDIDSPVGVADCFP